MGKYVVVFGGCGWDCTFKQRADLSYASLPDVELPGGKGANQAVACARAGYKVKMISIVGDDEIGEKTIKNLQDNGVDVSAVKVLKGVKSDSCKIYVSIDGTNEIVRCKEAIEKFDLSLIHENEEIIKNAEFVITQSKMPKEVYSSLIEFCYANGVKTILTPCPSKELKINEGDNAELLKKVTYITANEVEAKEVAQVSEVQDLFKKLPNLITTAGEKGVFFLDNGQVCHVPAIQTQNIVDTTGAGDTFCGNFAVALLQGYSKVEAVKIGVQASTIKLGKIGAQPGMPYKEELEMQWVR